MNITLFYHRISQYYFKRALALLVLGVLMSLLIPGLHILFYLVMVLLGMTFVCMYFIYAKEVNRSREAMKVSTSNMNQNLIVNKYNLSYCFFGFDGVMKSRVSFREGVWKLELNDRETAMKKDRKSLKLYMEEGKKYIFTGRNDVWKDTNGNKVVFLKKGEGWNLFINEEKVCSLTRGKLPLLKQQVFDPSSIVILFEDIDEALKQWAFLFIVQILEDYYVL
jgi:hypothetical protein